MSHLPNRRAFDRLMELLAAGAVGDLSREEQRELDQLLDAQIADEAGRPADTAQIDRTIGAFLAGMHEADETLQVPMPTAAKSRLAARGVAMLASRNGGGTASGSGAGSAPRNASLPWIGWTVAAALAIVAVVGWMRQPATPVAPPAPVARSLTEQRQQLIADQVDTISRDFGATADPAAQGVTGDVVWNNRLQEGYLRFRGLAVNDPAELQYQLWIFDAGRPDGMDFPVDGGVFDVAAAQQDPATGDVIIPINAKLPVVDPAAFAVTIERPGGVVVTKRERVLVLAAVDG